MSGACGFVVPAEGVYRIVSGTADDIGGVVGGTAERVKTINNSQFEKLPDYQKSWTFQAGCFVMNVANVMKAFCCHLARNPLYCT